MSLICIKTFSHRLEAEIAKGLLEAHNIPATISADDAGGMYMFPNQSGFSPVKLLINQQHTSTAEKILATISPNSKS